MIPGDDLGRGAAMRCIRFYSGSETGGGIHFLDLGPSVIIHSNSKTLGTVFFNGLSKPGVAKLTRSCGFS